MVSFLSWEYFVNMTGEFEANLECIPVLSDSSEMGPPVSWKKDKHFVVEYVEMDMPMSPHLIYRDTLCTFSKMDSMR